MKSIILLAVTACLYVPSAAVDLILEDFEHHNVGLFNKSTGTQNMQIISDAAYHGNYGAAFAGGEDNASWYWRTYSTNTTPGQTIFGYVNLSGQEGDGNAGGRAAIGVGANANGTMSMVADGDESRVLLRLNPGYGNGTTVASANMTWESNVWYRMELVYGIGVATVNVYNANRTSLLSTTGQATIGFSQVGGLAFQGMDQGSIDGGRSFIDKVGISGVPEPSSLIAVALGAICLAGRRRRK